MPRPPLRHVAGMVVWTVRVSHGVPTSTHQRASVLGYQGWARKGQPVQCLSLMYTSWKLAKTETRPQSCHQKQLRLPPRRLFVHHCISHTASHKVERGTGRAALPTKNGGNGSEDELREPGRCRGVLPSDLGIASRSSRSACRPGQNAPSGSTPTTLPANALTLTPNPPSRHRIKGDSANTA